ncbi:MAG: iron ABC transporter permease [Thermoanaerobaculia bacterium]
MAATLHRTHPVSGAASLARWRHGRRTPRLLAVVAVGTALVVNLPLVYIFVRAAARGGSAYAATVWTGQTLELLRRTLSLVGGVLVTTLVISLLMAWLVVRTDLPGRRIWAVLGALPLVFPSYIAAFCLVAVMGPRGYLQGWLEALGVGALPPWIYGYSGALLVLSLFTYPYTYLLLVAALRDLDPAFEEGSRSLGAGRWATFFRVTLPNLRPAILGGSLLAALYTLSDFGGVSIVRYNTFTLSIYNAYRALFDRTVAAGLSTVLVLLTLGFVALEAALVRRVRPSRSRPARPGPLVRLGAWKWPALAVLSAIALVNLAIPLGVIVYWGVRAIMFGNPLGEAWRAALHSAGVSAGAALVAVALALPVAYWAARSSGRLARVVERLCHSGFALPGIVIGLALVFFATRLLRPIYQSVTLLLIAYVVRFLPQALAAARASLAVLAPVFEEAARSLGRGPWSVFRSVVVPVIRPGLLAGGGLVFLTAMKELPATLLLRPTGFETLATRIWTTASEGIYSQAAVPSLLLLAGSALPLYLLVIRPALYGSRRAEWAGAAGSWG